MDKIKSFVESHLLTETTALDMQISGQKNDTLKVVINGTQYFYRPTNGMEISQFINKVNAIARFSYGKALAWIKNNSEVVNKVK